jgi:hypothetical protein
MTDARDTYRLEKAKRDARLNPELSIAKEQFDELEQRWKLDRSAPTPHNHPLRPMNGGKRKR